MAARAVAAQALSIFGDHQDVMAARQTGFALLSSNSVQEAMDMALIAHAATLESRIPFLHFFDGFRTSHEVAKIEQLSLDDMRAMIDDELVHAHRERALSPDHPVLRGSAQNPDVYFQARESVNPYYLACPTIVQNVMDKFAGIVGRQYQLFDYVGAPDAETRHHHDGLRRGSGPRNRRLSHGARQESRPAESSPVSAVLASSTSWRRCRKTVKSIAVLDRTKEPGRIGEPLYQDVVTALTEGFTAAKRRWRASPKSSAAATACRRRNLRPRWCNACSTS